MLAGEVDPRSRMQRVSSESSVLTSCPRLLERRVRRFDARPGAWSCAALSDELRKSFMKPFAADAATVGRPVHSLSSLKRRSRVQVIDRGALEGRLSRTTCLR